MNGQNGRYADQQSQYAPYHPQSQQSQQHQQQHQHQHQQQYMQNASPSFTNGPAHGMAQASYSAMSGINQSPHYPYDNATTLLDHPQCHQLPLEQQLWSTAAAVSTTIPIKSHANVPRRESVSSVQQWHVTTE